MITTSQKIWCLVCIGAVAVTACSGKTFKAVHNDTNNPTNYNRVINETKLYYVDLKSPDIVQPINLEDNANGKRFVQVEVVEVVNPKRYPVAFQIHYQTNAGDKIYLGSFGLFPADNPGKFIVATQGKVKDEGAIVLTLVKPQGVKAGDLVKVGLKKMAFVNG